jgi:type I restriction enzyme S subunit
VQPIDISADDLKTVQEILAAHVPDCEVWAFGSRATWTAKESSDLDIAVIAEAPLSATVLADLHDAFRESDLPFKVDVVEWNATGQSFRKIIEEKHVLLRRGAQKQDAIPTERA